MDFQDLLAQNGSFGGQNWGRGGTILTPSELVHLLGIVTSLPLLAEIDQEVQMSECRQTDTDTRTDRHKLNL